jgi:hypothetical protein
LSGDGGSGSSPSRPTPAAKKPFARPALLVDEVVRASRSLIVEGEVGLDERLSENALAARLGVSTTPGPRILRVAEAIAKAVADRDFVKANRTLIGHIARKEESYWNTSIPADRSCSGRRPDNQLDNNAPRRAAIACRRPWG